MKEKRLSGSEGIWTFVFIDMIIFAMIFFVFMVEKVRLPELYNASQEELNFIFGFVNALVLLTSSWMVVRAVRSSRKKIPQAVAYNLTFALLLGAIFVVSKILEYYTKIGAGIGIATNSFYSFYFFITFIHFLHVIAGLLFINSFRRRSESCTTSTASANYVTGLENVGLYWHFVDALWIFIFPILYLI